MSRLESNAEPSMEEILASIRKIIAEDSSGLRSPSPPRPGAAFSPSSRTSPLPSSNPAPQRGFMSREAFLRSSQPSEPAPEILETYTQSSPARSANAAAENLSSSSRLRQHEVAPAVNTARDQPRESVEARNSPSQSTERENELKVSEPENTPRNGSVSLEALSIESVEIEADADQTSTSVEPAILRPVSATDTSGIEAQLSQLLSEDLNALREGRDKSVIETVASAVDAFVSKSGEPANPSAGATPPSDTPTTSKSAPEGSDPFAFDLGPSPFAPKAEPQRPAQAAPVQSLGSPFDPPPTVVRPTNGSIGPIASGPARIEPTVTEPTPVTKQRQTFAVPSVSATLGPSRKLEPLSDAFRPAPAPQEKPIPAAELAPEPPLYTPEPLRAPEEPSSAFRSDRNDSVLQPASSPPALSQANESPLDRPMEDAVADLLRPLLKTWLAENMPKIVERALRREMSERLLPGQKNPRD